MVKDWRAEGLALRDEREYTHRVETLIAHMAPGFRRVPGSLVEGDRRCVSEDD